MTKDEIKAAYSMAEIIAPYGLHPNRTGFVCCPFHREKTPSMKIYPESYHCFGCGESGDIFTFVGRMDGIPFKEVLAKLGGGTMSWRASLEVTRRTRERQKQRQKEKHQAAERRELQLWLRAYRDVMAEQEPFSDVWCYCQNQIAYLEYKQEESKGA